MSAEFIINCLIYPSKISVGLFHVNGYSVFINLTSNAECFDFTINNNCSCQISHFFQILKSMKHGSLFHLQQFHFMLNNFFLLINFLNNFMALSGNNQLQLTYSYEKFLKK